MKTLNQLNNQDIDFELVQLLFTVGLFFLNNEFNHGEETLYIFFTKAKIVTYNFISFMKK